MIPKLRYAWKIIESTKELIAIVVITQRQMQ